MTVRNTYRNDEMGVTVTWASFLALPGLVYLYVHPSRAIHSNNHYWFTETLSATTD
jgi:hypothetical protein